MVIGFLPAAEFAGGRNGWMSLEKRRSILSITTGDNPPDLRMCFCPRGKL